MGLEILNEYGVGIALASLGLIIAGVVSLARYMGSNRQKLNQVNDSLNSVRNDIQGLVKDSVTTNERLAVLLTEVKHLGSKWVPK